MALSMQQAVALQNMDHYAAAIAAIVGPLATAGSDAYRTHADSAQSRKELKQRRREFEAMIPLYKQRQQQSALDTIADVRRAQISGGYQAAYAPYLLGAVAVGGLTLAAIALSKGGKRGR